MGRKDGAQRLRQERVWGRRVRARQNVSSPVTRSRGHFRTSTACALGWAIQGGYEGTTRARRCRARGARARVGRVGWGRGGPKQGPRACVRSVGSPSSARGSRERVQHGPWVWAGPAQKQQTTKPTLDLAQGRLQLGSPLKKRPQKGTQKIDESFKNNWALKIKYR